MQGVWLYSRFVFCVSWPAKKTNCLLIGYDTHCPKKLTVNDVIKQFCSSGSSRSSSSIALNLSPCKENLTFSLRISSSETDSLHLIVGWVFANCYSVRVTWQAHYPNFFCPTLKFASLCPGQHQVSSWWDSTVSSSMLPWCQVNQGES